MTMARTLKITLAIVALLAGIAVVGWHTWRGLERGAGSWVAGDERATTSAASRRVVWRAPRESSPGLAGGGAITRIAYQPDGRRAVLAGGVRGRDATLWLVEFDGQRVASERPLTELDEPGDELAPWFDGEMLLFASDRAGGRGGLDLWSARFDGERFERAQHLTGDSNSPLDDTDPTRFEDEIVFASDRFGAGFDLWAARIDADTTVVRLDALSGPGDERDPAFGPDGGSLWYCSRVAGSFDLARAFRTDGEWFANERVVALSSDLDERAPCPLGAGFELAFLRAGSADDGRAMTMWRAQSVELALVPPLAWTLAEALLLASLLLLAAAAWFARDASAYDTWIAAWAVSVLVHILLMLVFGDVRMESSLPGASEDPGRAIRVRVAPDEGRSELTRARDGDSGRIERADIARREVTSELVATSDLVAEVESQPDSAPIAQRERPVEPRSTSPRVLDDAASSSIPHADLDAQRESLPAFAVGARATMRSTELAPRAALARAIEAPVAESAHPLQIENRSESTPDIARADVALPALSSTERALREPDAKTRSSPFPAVATTEDSKIAALAPVSTRRETARPELARSEAVSLAPGSDRSNDRDELRMPSLLEAQPRTAPADIAPAPRESATPYGSRAGAAKERALAEHGGTRATEDAVARGLAYLARIQGRFGAWGPLEVNDDKYGEIAVGKTALATLAFLAAGHTRASSTEHSAVVQRALAFLLSTQDKASGHFGDTSSYGHGITTFALAEALAITGDEALRSAVERAVLHVLARQSRDPDPRKFGGWPYYYTDADRTFDPWPRTSITAWHVLALESARISGIEVPDQAFADAARFLDAAREPNADWYRYAHDPTRLRSAYPTLPASTPAAMFALSCIGRDVSGSDFAGARRYVLERAPSAYRFTGERDFVERAQGNPYFWYQGSLAMLRVGGSEWKRWNVALQATLLPSQAADGSWKPIDPYARYARDDESDRAYTTALCVLCLEVYYRYDLPLLNASRAAGATRVPDRRAGASPR